MNAYDDIAMSNLKILSSGFNKGHRFLVEGHVLQEAGDDETYDNMFSLKDLEYPVIFSFFRASQMLERGNRSERRKVLFYLDYTLDTLHHLINQSQDSEDIKISFKNIVNDLEEMYGKLEETHFSRTIYCHPTFSEIFKTGEALFENFVNLLQSSKQYLYLTPVTIDLTLDPDEDSDEESNEECEKDE